MKQNKNVFKDISKIVLSERSNAKKITDLEKLFKLWATSCVGQDDIVVKQTELEVHAVNHRNNVRAIIRNRIGVIV